MIHNAINYIMYYCYSTCLYIEAQKQCIKCIIKCVYLILTIYVCVPELLLMISAIGEMRRARILSGIVALASSSHDKETGMTVCCVGI